MTNPDGRRRVNGRLALAVLTLAVFDVDGSKKRN